MLFSRLALILLILPLGLGCAGESKESGESDELRTSPSLFVPFTDAFDLEALTEDQLHEIHLTGNKIGSMIREEVDWKSIDNEARELLDTHRDHPAEAQIHQIIGNQMINHVLVSAPPTEKRNDAMGRYVSLLLDTNHPDMRAFNTAFQSLQGFWSDEQLLESIEEALEHGACGSCTQGGISVDTLEAAREEMRTLKNQIQ